MMFDYSISQPPDSMQQAYGDLWDMASMVVVDANWHQEMQAVTHARILGQSFYSAVYGYKSWGWPVPFDFQSEDHRRWCVALCACGRREIEEAHIHTVIHFTANEAETTQYLTYMRDAVDAVMQEEFRNSN